MKEEKLKVQFERIKEIACNQVPVLENKDYLNTNFIQSSRIEIDNPEADFPKTYLELYGNPENLIGCYASENGRKDNCFFLLSDVENCISTNQNINDIFLTRNHSLWILTTQHIGFKHDVDSEEKIFPLSGMKLIGSSNESTWVVGLNEAWFLDSDFKNPRSYPWKGGIHSVECEGRICTFNKTKDKIIWLDQNGVETEQAVSANHGFFENLVGAWNTKYMTLEASTFRIYDISGILAELPLQSVGLLTDGESFISFSKNGKTFLISNKEYLKWEFPHDNTNRILPIVAETENKFLFYNLGFWGESDKSGFAINSVKKIDSAHYKEIIDPKRWKLGQSKYYQVLNENEIIVSITGPNGVILVKISFKI